MKPIYLAVLLTLVVLIKPVRSQDATGYSSIAISGSTVSGSGYTQLDYTSAAYYEVGTTVVLHQGDSE